MNRLHLAIILLLLSSLAFIVAQLLIIPQLDNPITSFIASIMVTIPLAYFMIFNKKNVNHHHVFTLLSLYGIPIIALGAAMLFLFKPQVAGWMATEDFIVENITALAACFAGVIIMVATLAPRVKKSTVRIVGAIIVGLAFIVIGMEEISWGQRIFDIQSGDFFLKHNWQNETNLHNLHTSISMAIFYVATFIIFIILPLYRQTVAKVLEKLRLKSLAIFIPNDWTAVVYASTVGFMAFASNHQYQIFILVFTLLFLYYMHIRDTSSKISFAILLSTLVIMVSLSVTVFPTYESIGLQNWFFYEWREMLICLVIFVYSVDFAFTVASPKLKKSLNESHKTKALETERGYTTWHRKKV